MIKPLFQHVLVMVNGTEASINAVKYAILMAKLYKTRVTAVYVVDTATIRQLTLNRIFIEEESAEYEKSLTDNGKRYLAFVDELGRAKGVKIATELRSGAIWSEVVSLAETAEADAILMGGQEPVAPDEREIISTTYRSVLIHARCSVIVVKERMIDQLYRLA
jgi:nucleotide-binding universal stress UspA family protein